MHPVPTPRTLLPTFPPPPYNAKRRSETVVLTNGLSFAAHPDVHPGNILAVRPISLFTPSPAYCAFLVLYTVALLSFPGPTLSLAPPPRRTFLLSTSAVMG
jgi:hypothetical protein